MKLLFTLLIVLTISYLTSNYAVKRGRDRTGWFILGFCFGIFALATVLILPPIKKEEEEEKPQVLASDLAPPLPTEPVDIFADYEWHYIDVNGKQKGPLDILDLQIAWEDGLVSKNAYVWREGMDEWGKVCDIHGLNNRLQNAPKGHDS
jgi:GYF domain 2